MCEKVKEAITAVESSEDSSKEYNYLKHMYKLLNKKEKLSEKQKKLLSLIEPVMMKYAHYDSFEPPELVGEKLFRYNKPEGD